MRTLLQGWLLSSGVELRSVELFEIAFIFNIIAFVYVAWILPREFKKSGNNLNSTNFQEQRSGVRFLP